ncbi:antibiotic biosynthesis monooxygenase family protein [Priestia megaterium]|uniref:antibiotic biosynthesis monooxygenase family protein n=1 Tax=Priestia megaterium TaxID=1404 RepID=UPI002452D128|nr:antibiotic biosynthesis monooxygenase [Priestia megaterium]MDH3139157.1 antibiotic biosynthesis monooxygenase [Priestia megaterium]MED4241007.1 antibiotic biosynthesis monooxygenase [Priestia megaterium]MED4267705.1 antibiotic biosynthesis monooxygenase [Priestia megaterium]MED4280180.1 antibiotic biosynthesis monooxygenase [Priestia megaterium]MED4319679.1 antibiotic biosynthesis monooxygenase [Priestia megaterium]
MPKIEENQLFTVIIEWEVNPKYQQELINGLSNQIETYFKGYDGFISSSFHASEDGKRVINYAQWISREAWSNSFQALGRDEVQTTNDEIISSCEATTLKLNCYRVARVIENI